MACGPPDQAPTPNPIGGSSLLRDAPRQSKANWVKGAAGEYLIDQLLHKRLTTGEVILTDRRVPNSRANIDFVVVARSGLWVIDAKKWTGKIDYRPTKMGGVNTALFIDGVDRSDVITAIYQLVIPVRQLVPNWSIPISPALVFVDADWSNRALWRLIADKPYVHENVYICTPRSLCKQIQMPGPLSDDAVRTLAAQLDRELPPR